jgi:hypothetical protein
MSKYTKFAVIDSEGVVWGIGVTADGAWNDASGYFESEDPLGYRVLYTGKELEESAEDLGLDIALITDSAYDFISEYGYIGEEVDIVRGSNITGSTWPVVVTSKEAMEIFE